MKPTDRNVMRFTSLWYRAQKKGNVARMENLLEHKWFAFWWCIFTEGHKGQPMWSTAQAAVTRILEEKGMIPTPPERPSERAMRIAEEKWKNEPAYGQSSSFSIVRTGYPPAICVGCGLEEGPAYPKEPTVIAREDGLPRCADCERTRKEQV